MSTRVAPPRLPLQGSLLASAPPPAADALAEPERQELGSGAWVDHDVPKRATVDGPRISVTWRWSDAPPANADRTQR